MGYPGLDGLHRKVQAVSAAKARTFRLGRSNSPRTALLMRTRYPKRLTEVTLSPHKLFIWDRTDQLSSRGTRGLSDLVTR